MITFLDIVVFVLFCFMVIQYGIILNLFMDNEYNSKQKLLHHLIPFYWVVCAIKEIKEIWDGLGK